MQRSRNTCKWGKWRWNPWQARLVSRRGYWKPQLLKIQSWNVSLTNWIVSWVKSRVCWKRVNMNWKRRSATGTRKRPIFVKNYPREMKRYLTYLKISPHRPNSMKNSLTPLTIWNKHSVICAQNWIRCNCTMLKHWTRWRESWRMNDTLMWKRWRS